MSEIEVPEGVGFASLAVVGRVARVLLRSDGRYLCALCKLSPIAIGGEVEGDWAAYWHDLVRRGVACQHIDDVRRQGVVRLLQDAEGRQYPEFIWKRGGHSTVAPWPAKDDPDGAVATLAGALQAGGGMQGYTADYYVAVAEAAVRQLRRRGYVVVPEWLSRVKPAPAGRSGRGARVIDFGDE